MDLIDRIVEQCDPLKNGKMNTNEAATTSACNARSELFLSIILDILPFIGKLLCQKQKDFLCNILETLKNIFNVREETLPPAARKMLSTFNQVSF